MVWTWKFLAYHSAALMMILFFFFLSMCYLNLNLLWLTYTSNYFICVEKHNCCMYSMTNVEVTITMETVLILWQTGAVVNTDGLFAEKEEQKKEKKKKKKEEPSSMFQRQRVDLLLGELAKKYPPQFIPPPQPEVKGKGTSAVYASSLILRSKVDVSSLCCLFNLKSKVSEHPPFVLSVWPEVRDNCAPTLYSSLLTWSQR